MNKKTTPKVYKLRKYVSGSVYDLENLAKKQINCVSPKLFNDPIDTYFYYSDDKCFSKSKEILTKEIMDTIRISCFMDYEKNPSENKENRLLPSEILMWTHYADSHKGFCLEYDVPAENFGYLDRGCFDNKKRYMERITYLENLATDFESVFSKEQDEYYSNANFEDLLGTCFFSKDESFKYESEVRLLQYAEKNAGDYIPLKFDYLSKIIFGERCAPDLKNLISCINKQVYNNRVELYEINRHFQEIKYEK